MSQKRHKIYWTREAQERETGILRRWSASKNGWKKGQKEETYSCCIFSTLQCCENYMTGKESYIFSKLKSCQIMEPCHKFGCYSNKFPYVYCKHYIFLNQFLADLFWSMKSGNNYSTLFYYDTVLLGSTKHIKVKTNSSR